ILGHIEGGLKAGERRLRSLYERRAQLADEWDTTNDTTVRDRAAKAGRWVEAGRRSLDELARHTQERGVTLGVETRLHYHEIPGPAELAGLLEAYPSEVAGYVHDVGHAEVQHRLGLTDRSAWWDLLGARLVALHLSD